MEGSDRVGARLRVLFVAAGVACGALLIAGWLGLLQRAVSVHWNSDLFFIRSLYEDVFVNGRGIGGWNLPPAPYFFPDMLLLFPSFAASGSLFGGYLLFGALLFPIFLMGVLALMRELDVPMAHAAHATLWAALAFIAAMQGADPSMLVFFLPIFHAGACVAGVWLLVAWTRAFRRGYSAGGMAWVLLLSVLLTLSDLFSVTQLFVPMVGVVIVLRLRNRIDPTVADTTLALVVAAGVIDLVVLGILGQLLPVRFVGNPIFAAFAHQLGPLPPLALGALIWLGWRSRARVRASHLLVVAAGAVLLPIALALARPDVVADAVGGIHVKPGWPMSGIRLFASDVAQMAVRSPLLWLAAIVLPLGCGVWLWRGAPAPSATDASPGGEGDARLGGAREAVALFVVISTGVGLLAAALEWIGTGWPIFPELEIYREGTTRHMQPVFVYPIFGIATIIALWPALHRPRLLMLGAAVMLSYAALGIAGHAPALAGWGVAPYADYQRCLDELYVDEDLSTGYGDYWTARSLSYGSRVGVRIRPLREPLEIEPWVHSMAGFLPLPSDGHAYDRYDFIVPSRFSRAEIEARFGAPARQAECAGLGVLIYDRADDLAFRHFTRVPALLGAGRQTPSRIRTPEILGTWVPEGTPLDEGNSVALDTAAGLIVEIADPVAGDVLELAASAAHALDVVPRSAEGVEWPTIRVASVPEAEGSATRFVELPGQGQVRWSGFSIHVAEPPHPGPVWVGHLFVYPDTF